MVSAEKPPLTSSSHPRPAVGKVGGKTKSRKVKRMLAAVKAVADGRDNPADLFAELDANGHDTSQLGKNAPVTRTPAHVPGKLTDATRAWLSQNGHDLAAVESDQAACAAAMESAGRVDDTGAVLADIGLFYHHKFASIGEDEVRRMKETIAMEYDRPEQHKKRRKDAQNEHYVRNIKVKVTMLKRCGKDVNAPKFNKALLIEGCEHGRRRSHCKECGGASICDHGRQRQQCKECGGASICGHGLQRSRCKECGGSQICEHDRQRHRCKECRAVKAEAS